MTSYQRRLREIEFYKQRGEDLEQIAMMLAHELNQRKIPIPLSPISVVGDRFLNDMPDFQMRLLSA